MCSCLRYTFEFKASLLFSITATEQQQKHLQYFYMLLRTFLQPCYTLRAPGDE